MKTIQQTTNHQEGLGAFDYLLFCVWAALPFAIFFYVRG